MAVFETFRPNLHFAPGHGWMNDPNGMIYDHGIYHLFFQHDPDSIHHGPMHWGHAISKDLVHWEEQPLALRPDHLGTCFSGSAVRTADGAVKLFYTAHRVTDDGKDFQVQCLVHVGADLASFKADDANPVIDNPGCVVFRDPKVIWHKQSERWILVLTAGQSIAFYSSVDLQSWSLESHFGEGEGRHGKGVWECPDLLEMTAPDGKSVWVLIVSLSEDAYGAGSGTQYFIGDFDGHVFTNANPSDTELWLDYGRDFYAPQSFYGGPGDRPLLMAWFSNWAYARQTPTEQFRGTMSLPRRLRLVQGQGGYRLAHAIPQKVRDAFVQPQTDAGTYRLYQDLELAIGERVSIALFGESVPQYGFYRKDAGTIAVETRRDGVEGMHDFGHAYDIVLNWPLDMPLSVEMFVDRGMVELLVAGGLVSISNLFFPANPDGAVVVDKAMPSIVPSNEPVAGCEMQTDAGQGDCVARNQHSYLGGSNG